MQGTVVWSNQLGEPLAILDRKSLTVERGSPSSRPKEDDEDVDKLGLDY